MVMMSGDTLLAMTLALRRREIEPSCSPPACGYTVRFHSQIKLNTIADSHSKQASLQFNMRLLLCVVLLSSVLAITSSPYWLTTPHIQTFTVTMVNTLTVSSALSSTTTYSTILNRTFTTLPNVVLSCNWLQTYYFYGYYLHYLTLFSNSVSTLTLRLDVSEYAYLFRATVMLYTSELLASIRHTTFSTPAISNYYSYINYSYEIPMAAVNTSSKILIIPYLVGITQYCSSSYFGSGIKTSIINSTYFSALYLFNTTTNGYIISAYFLIIDVNLLQSTRTIYIDHYTLPIGVTLSTLWSSTSNSFQSATYLDTPCTNKMMGYSGWFTYYFNSYFYYSCGDTAIAYYSGYVSSVGFTVTNFRYRMCDFGTPYYHETTNLCYEKCPIRYYGVPQYLYCLPCPYHCLTCLETGVLCLTCSNADFRTLINITTVNVSMAGVCECKTGYFDDNLNHSVCVACHYSCLACANATIKCLGCNGYRQLKPNNSCPCVVGFQDIASTPNCTEICGDGVKIVLACDDGNTVAGDGCSATCTIQTSYSCREFNTTSSSTCSYNQPLLFTVTSLVVNNATFTIVATVSVAPSLPWMSTYNFSLLASNDSEIKITSSTFSSGTITLTCKYSDLSDGNTALLTFFSPNTSTTFAIPNSSFSLSVPALVVPIPQPVTPAYLQTVSNLLYAMSGVNLVVYLVGGLKLAYVQTIWTLQISYFCLMGSYLIQPLQQVFRVINAAANGYNRVNWQEINTNTFSPNLPALGYNDQFLANLNIMLVVQMSVLALSLTFYGLAKINKFQNGKRIFLCIHAFMLYDGSLSLVLFNTLNSSFAMGLQIIVFIQQGLHSLSSLNIVGMFLSFGITIISVCLFIFRTNQFTNNVGMFKHHKQSVFHPLVMLGVRFSMGFIMGILYRHWYSGLIVLGIQLGYGIFISIKNPYTMVFLLRAILNEGTILQNLLIGFLYQVGRINESDKGGLVPLWIQTFLLGVTCLSSLFYMVYTIYMKIKNLRSNNKVEIQDEVKESMVEKQKRTTKSLVELDHNVTQENLVENQVQNTQVEFYEGRTRRNRMKGVDY